MYQVSLTVTLPSLDELNTTLDYISRKEAEDVVDKWWRSYKADMEKGIIVNFSISLKEIIHMYRISGGK